MVEQVGKYTLLKKIAMGGMAEIHLAEQSGPGGFKKRLVIKRILPHLVGDQNFLQMFQDEARLAAMMNHPNIVQIFELGELEDTYYIAMEYVAGYTLRNVIQIASENSFWLSPEYIAKLGSQICEGLEYAHNFCDADGKHLQLIHRDISPQNLILSNQGVVKIVDFGIAKASSNVGQTQAGTIKGKLAYMSPEQVKGMTLDRRSDLFSLGIVLYELATYNRPFLGKSDIDMLRAVLNTPPTPIANYGRPDFPEELNKIILRSLAKNRDERYQSARELQWDLERFIQGYGRPIGPFQLQELVQHLEAHDPAKEGSVSPAAQPPPAPAPPAPPTNGARPTPLPSPSMPPAAPPLPRHPQALEAPLEETRWNPDSPPSGHLPPPSSPGYSPSPYAPAQPNYPPPSPQTSWQTPPGPAPLPAPSSAWGHSAPQPTHAETSSGEWEEDEDATVLSLTPPVNPAGGPGSRNAAVAAERDLDTINDPLLHSPYAAPTLLDGQVRMPDLLASAQTLGKKPQPRPVSAPPPVSLAADEPPPSKSRAPFLIVVVLLALGATAAALYFFVL